MTIDVFRHPPFYGIAIVFFTISLSTVIVRVDAHQTFDRSRCRCICPNTSVVEETRNMSYTDRRVYTRNVNAKDCNCEHVVLPTFNPQLSESLGNKFCLRCSCSYQTRDTTMIEVVVILVICVVSLLIVYMGFLLCLDPFLKQPRKDHMYERHHDDEDNIFASPQVGGSRDSPSSIGPLPLDAETRQRRPSDGVLSRVEARQNKWFQKVHEQRRKIFTDHSMLN